MTDETIVGYAVPKLCRWEDMLADGPGFFRNIPIGAPPGQVGYMPIYKTLEALRAAWGDQQSYMVLRQPPAE